MSSSSKSFVIIGAGLSGLATALALSQRGLACTVYEARPKAYNEGGAIMLSPNALRILDKLGVYEHIRMKGFEFDVLTFKDETHKTTDVYYFGDEELYGYRGLRLYRHELIEVLRTKVEQLNVPIHYGRKFSHIISEDKTHVEFQLSNGEVHQASFVIGADGIHSTVRRYLKPDCNAAYVGFLAITSSAPRSALRFPQGVHEDYPLPVSLHGKNGAFVLAPQSQDGQDIFFGTQRRYDDSGKDGWKTLLSNKDELINLLNQNKELWPDLAQSAIENARSENMNIWAFHTVPKLEQWTSKAGRVIILGDAASAIPPTTGQGVNQAFEGVFGLVLLLSHPDFERRATDALAFWQKWRQERIDALLELTQRMNNKRLPESEKQKLSPDMIWKGSGSSEEMRWLYDIDVEELTLKWINGESL